MQERQEYSFIGVDPIILDGERIVLAQRGKGSAVDIGKWHIPGALVKADENFEQALKRAVLEKTGLEVELLTDDVRTSFVSFYDTIDREPRYRDVAMSFLCKIVGGNKKPGPRMVDVRSFSEAEINDLQIGFDHRQIVQDGIQRLKDLGYIRS